MPQVDRARGSSGSPRAGSAATASPERQRRHRLTVAPLPPGRTGDPGLFEPSSIFWRVNRERALLLSAQSVVLMQLAHPLIAAAVAEHTDRHRSLPERLGATLALNLAVIFGDREQAGRAASHVRELHAGINGRLGAGSGSFAAGSPYRADDPELLRWGHATIVWAGVECYSRFVEPLAPPERDRYVAEARTFGAAFGLDAASLPSTFEEVRGYVFSMIEGKGLAVGEDARREAREILWPDGTWGERAAGPAQRVITAGLLPDPVRRWFGLAWDVRERAAFSLLRGATRAAVRSSPPRIRWWPHYRTARSRVAGR
jgi:uncharacterized protein (DUF2236 family)